MINQVLWIEHGDGAAVAHPAVPYGDPCLAIIDGRSQRAQPVRLASGQRLVPSSELVPAAPLSDEEEREYRILDAQLAGTIGEARTLRRFNALRLRSLKFGGEA